MKLKNYSLAPNSSKITDYLDGFQYENCVMQFVSTSEGYFDFIQNTYFYNYTDHLGNVRISYYKNSAGALQITDANDYYSFGMNILKTNTAYAGVGSYSNLKYNGKELQGTGMYDYGFRQYMPEIGRWHGMDRLSESYNSSSPYAYVLNNPIMMYDPNGMVTKEWVNSFNYGSRGGGETDYYFDSNGNHGDGQFSSLGSQTGVAQKAYNYIAGGGTGNYSYWTGEATSSSSYSNSQGMYNGNIDLGVDHVLNFSQSNYNFNPYTPKTSNIFDNVNWEKFNNVSGNIAYGSSLITSILDYQVRNNYKSASGFANKAFEELKLTQKEWRYVNTLGETGAKYVKYVKGLGTIAEIANIGYSTLKLGENPTAGNATRVAVQGLAIGAALIPGVGWAVSLGIGTADAIWGDQFYNWIDKY